MKVHTIDLYAAIGLSFSRFPPTIDRAVYISVTSMDMLITIICIKDRQL